MSTTSINILSTTRKSSINLCLSSLHLLSSLRSNTPLHPFPFQNTYFVQFYISIAISQLYLSFISISYFNVNTPPLHSQKQQELDRLSIRKPQSQTQSQSQSRANTRNRPKYIVSRGPRGQINCHDHKGK